MTIRNLLLISRCPPFPLHLGDRLIIGNLVPALIEHGVTVDLIALCPPQPGESPLMAYERDQALQSHYTDSFRQVTLLQEPPRSPLGFLWRIANTRSRFPKSAQQAWSPQLYRQVQHHLSQQRYDAILLFGSVQVYELAHALGGHSAVITPYESFTLYLDRVQAQQPSWANLARRWVAAQYERFMFTPYERVVVLAEPDAAVLRSADPTLDIRVIPNGVHLPPHTDQPRDDATLLFVGNFEYAPNAEAAQYLIHHLLPTVRQTHPQAQLWLVGNAPPADLRQHANEHIRITGYVDDLTPYYQQATAFISPLTVGAGLKNKVLEALAHRLPVIATPLSVDGIHVAHQQSALIGNIADLPTLTLRVLNDNALRLRLGQAGRSVVEHEYSWASVAQRYLALFEEVRVTAL